MSKPRSKDPRLVVSSNSTSMLDVEVQVAVKHHIQFLATLHRTSGSWQERCADANHDKAKATGRKVPILDI